MILIIGYGSPLRSDDSIGQRAADALGALHPGWQVITAVQLTPELADPIAHADHAVFIDAAMGAIPGEVRCESLQSAELESAFTHHASPSGLLASARALHGSAPPSLLITITGASFEIGSDLSPTLEQAFPEIVRKIERLIHE